VQEYRSLGNVLEPQHVLATCGIATSALQHKQRATCASLKEQGFQERKVYGGARRIGQV
jgi:hypothetical protein